MQRKVKKVSYRWCISIDTFPIQIHCSQIQWKDTKNVSRYVSGRYSIWYSHTLVATQRVSLTLKSLILSPLLLGCCHSSSMLSFLLRCFHFSYQVVALSPMLLLLHQYCCSSFNIAAPPSMLPLHLDVASPPSILTLQRVSEMRMVICRKEQFSWWPPPLMLPLFLWWIDVSAPIAPPLLLLLFLECCNAPVKMNYFQLQVLPTGHYTRG